MAAYGFADTFDQLLALSCALVEPAALHQLIGDANTMQGRGRLLYTLLKDLQLTLFESGHRTSEEKDRARQLIVEHERKGGAADQARLEPFAPDAHRMLGSQVSDDKRPAIGYTP